jgi:hypothetical protein
MNAGVKLVREAMLNNERFSPMGCRFEHEFGG